MVATTVAERGRPESAATSPKKSPTSRRRISSGRPFPPTTRMRTLPDAMRKMLSPGSPSLTTIPPGGTRRRWRPSATRRNT